MLGILINIDYYCILNYDIYDILESNKIQNHSNLMFKWIGSKLKLVSCGELNWKWLPLGEISSFHQKFYIIIIIIYLRSQ